MTKINDWDGIKSLLIHFIAMQNIIDIWKNSVLRFLLRMATAMYWKFQKNNHK